MSKVLIYTNLKYKYQLGYYLIGLLEGDSYISIPYLDNITLNKVLYLIIVLPYILIIYNYLLKFNFN